MKTLVVMALVLAIVLLEASCEYVSSDPDTQLAICHNEYRALNELKEETFGRQLHQYEAAALIKHETYIRRYCQ